MLFLLQTLDRTTTISQLSRSCNDRIYIQNGKIKHIVCSFYLLNIFKPQPVCLILCFQSCKFPSNKLHQYREIKACKSGHRTCFCILWLQVPGKVRIIFLVAFEGDFSSKQSCIILFHVRRRVVPCEHLYKSQCLKQVQAKWSSGFLFVFFFNNVPVF